MSLMVRFVRYIFVTIRNVLIFIMATTTHTLLRKIKNEKSRDEARNAASLFDNLIVLFAVISQRREKSARP